MIWDHYAVTLITYFNQRCTNVIVTGVYGRGSPVRPKTCNKYIPSLSRCSRAPSIESYAHPLPGVLNNNVHGNDRIYVLFTKLIAISRASENYITTIDINKVQLPYAVRVSVVGYFRLVKSLLKQHPPPTIVESVRYWEWKECSLSDRLLSVLLSLSATFKHIAHEDH